MRQITTLAIIQDKDQVLLAMKKKGFGEGWWNGYGGKVNDGESVDDAMVRELWEESSINAKEFKKRGVVEFIFDGKDFEVEMHIYEVNKYDGEPIESEEMAPKWFSLTDIPYDNMWPADRNWMPLFFEGKDFEGRAIFNGETKELINSEFRTKEIDLEKDFKSSTNKYYK